MLHTLLESNAPRQRRRGSTVASIAVHTLAIGGAVVVTASARPGGGDRRPTIADTVIYVSPQRRPPRPAPTTTTSARSRQVGPPAPPSVPRWTIDLPPHGIERPAVDIDIRRLFGADSVPPGRALGPAGAPGGSRVAPIGDEPGTIATVERPAAMIAPPRPRYPDQLRAAGVTGRVVVRLVVDTAGRVEPQSVVIRESSHDLFTQSVRAVLPALRFRPAEVGGRRVRMLVELPFEFRLNE